MLSALREINMPKWRMEIQEQGERYRSIEVVADTEEEAREMISEDMGEVVDEFFKQRDRDELNFNRLD
jgi:hypothetical protein